MKEKEFEELKTYLESELDYDPTSPISMRDKASRIPNLLQKFLNQYETEKRWLAELELNLKECFASWYNKYKYPKKGDGFEFQYALDNKAEITIYVEGNKDYISKSLMVEKQKLQVEYLEKSIQNIKDMHWSLKNILDQMKFFEGS